MTGCTLATEQVYNGYEQNNAKVDQISIRSNQEYPVVCRTSEKVDFVYATRANEQDNDS